MKKIIVANWKLNPTSLKEAKKLALKEDHGGVIIAPPFIYLNAIGELLKNASLAAQDVFWEDSGAHTGEISTSQLKDININYVIVGHSERRTLGETDDIINKKVKAVLNADMQVILCVGEHLQIRKEGIEKAKEFIANQLKINLGGIKKRYSKNVIVAYEPIWSIGTGVSDIPEESAEISAYIKNISGVSRVLYGASVNEKNAKEFLSKDEIDGVLVGGASLKPREFKNIVDSA